MSDTRRAFTLRRAFDIENGTLHLDACAHCGCLISDPHTCFATTMEDVKSMDYNQTAELAVAEPHWATQPLTIAVTTRNGTTYVIDGVENDTRVSLSSLDAVDKAAIKVLLQQALREIDPPRTTTVTGGPYILNGWSLG